MTENTSPFLTVPELAKYLQVHEQTIYRMLNKGGFPAIKVGASWRVRKESLDRWIRETDNLKD